MQELNRQMMALPELRELEEIIRFGTGPAAVSGVSGVHRAMLGAALRQETKRPLAVLCADEQEARRMAADLAALTGEECVTLFAREWQLRDRVSASHSFEQERLDALCRMAFGRTGIVVATVDGMMQRTLPPTALRDAVLTLRLGEEHDLRALAERLTAAGYVRCEQVEGAGQFAVRGGILDVYSPMSAPVRVEFFDTEIDAMGEFDVATQRRTKNLEELTVLPAAEVLAAQGTASADSAAVAQAKVLVQDELVGVEAKADKRTIYSLSAPELQSLPSIGTAKEFDLEGCAALTPDLVIVPAKLKDSIPQMEELGLTVLAVKPEDQDKLYGAIDLLAQATNTVARGEELKSAIEDNLLSLHEAIGDAEAPTVYMAGNSSVLQTAGPAMYQNYMIENAGGLNAAASVEDTYWAEVSYEQVLDWDPDYIILASDADYDVDSVLNDAALADCTAVREGHVYQLPHAIEAVDSPVPGSFLGSVYLGSVLHPEQVSEQFYHDCADTFYTTYYGFTPASYE